MPKTKEVIVDLCQFACSIIIIGVGKANFAAMRELDGDGPGGLKDQKGRQASRDIVQFVEFNDACAKGDLAEQVLHEVPGQFVSFMQANGVKVDYTK